MKLKPSMPREQIARKQASSARGYDSVDMSDVADDVMSMSPEEFLSFVGREDVTITNPTRPMRVALRRKLARFRRERRILTICIVRLKAIVGD
jgi:hypothetical protein